MSTQVVRVRLCARGGGRGEHLTDIIMRRVREVHCVCKKTTVVGERVYGRTCLHLKRALSGPSPRYLYSTEEGENA